MYRIKLCVLVLALLLGAVALFVEPAAERVSGHSVTADLSAPTELTATDSVYATKVGLHWEPVAYAATYRIFRSTTNDPNTASPVGTTAANYYFDPTATAGTQYYYWVRAENTLSVSPLSTGDAGLRAVGNNSPGAPFPPLEPPIEPTGNPVTAAKAYLGKTLF